MFKRLFLFALIASISLISFSPARADSSIPPSQRLGTGIPTSIAASPDGKTLAVGSSIGVWLLDATTLQPVGFWDTGVWVNNVAYSTDGQYAKVNDSVLNAQSGQRANIDTSQVVWIDDQCSTNGLLCSRVAMDHVTIRDINIAVDIALLQHWNVKDVAWSPEGNRFYTVAGEALDQNYSVTAWDTRTWTRVNTLKDYFNPQLVSLAWSDDGQQIAARPDDRSYTNNYFGVVGKRIIWNTQDGSRSVVATCPYWSRAFDCVMPEIWFQYWQLYFRDAAGKTLQPRFPPHNLHLWSAALSSDKARFVTSGDDNYFSGTKTLITSARIWDSNSLQLLSELPTVFYAVNFSEDGKLVVGQSNNRLEVWDWATQQLLWHVPQVISPQCHRETGLCSVDHTYGLVVHGNYLASFASSNGNNVQLYNLTSGDLIASFIGHTASVTGLVFSPDGSQLAASSGDGTILIWQVP